MYSEALEGIDDLIDTTPVASHEEIEVESQFLQKDDEEIQNVESDVESFSNTAAALESIYQSSLPMYNKASDTEVRLIATSVCAVANSNGFTVGPSFSLESIDDNEPSKNAGRRMIRKIKEYALRIWTVLVESFETLMEWFTSFLQRVTFLSKRLRKKAEALRQLYAKTQNKNKEGAQNLLKGRVAAVLGVLDGTPQNAFKNLSELVSGLSDAGKGKYFDSLFAAIDKLEKNESGEKELDAFVSKVADTYNPLFPYETSRYSISGATGVEIGTSDILPGNYHAYMAIPRDGIGLNYFRYEFTNADLGSIQPDVGIPVLSYNDIPDILKYVTGICDTYERTSEIERELKSIKSKLEQAKKVLQRAVNKEDKNIDEVTTETERFNSAFRTSTLRGFLNFIPRATAGIHQKTISFALNRCKSALYWVDFSLAQYEPK